MLAETKLAIIQLFSLEETTLRASEMPETFFHNFVTSEPETFFPKIVVIDGADWESCGGNVVLAVPNFGNYLLPQFK